MLTRFKSLFRLGEVRVGSFTGLSRILGLVRDMVFSRLLGAGWIFDAFVVAYGIPNMLRDLLGEGALSSAVVARLGHVEKEGGKERVSKVANQLFGLWTLIFIAVTILGILLAPWLVWCYGLDAKSEELAVELTRWLFPYIAFMGFTALTVGVLYHLRTFGWASSGSSSSNVVVICFCLLAGIPAALSNIQLVRVAALAILAGGLAQWLTVRRGLKGSGIKMIPSWTFSDPEVWKILKLLGPSVLAVAGVQINVFVNRAYATHIGEGAASSLYYAFRLMHLPVGLFGVSVATVLLPRLSGHFAKEESSLFSSELSRALSRTSFLALPATAGLWVLGPDLISLIYGGHRFDTEAVDRTALALMGYVPGIWAYCLLKSLLQAFYARSDMRTPLYITLSSTLLNAGLNYTLTFVWNFGVLGLTLGTSLVLYYNVFVMLFSLHYRHGVKLQCKGIFLRVGWVILASLSMGAILIFARQSLGLDSILLRALFTVIGGGALFFAFTGFKHRWLAGEGL